MDGVINRSMGGLDGWILFSLAFCLAKLLPSG